MSERIEAAQFIPTSVTPPRDAGIYRPSQNVTGFVGTMTAMDPNTVAVTNVVTGANHSFEHVAMGSWDDLNFAAAGINPPGAANSATRDASTGMLVFAGNQDNVLAGCAQMPHKWIEGSEVRPHLHLRFPTASVSNSRWKFEYDVGNVNGLFNNAYGVYTTLATVTVANPNDARKSVVVGLGAITMTGFTLSAQIPWKLTRLASTDSLDTDTADAILTDLDFHYQSDTPGSRQEFIK